jgi:hypothetical protein
MVKVSSAKVLAADDMLTAASIIDGTISMDMAGTATMEALNTNHQSYFLLKKLLASTLASIKSTTALQF